MRISDWSSDVCSSDLRTPGLVMIYLETPKKFRGLIDQAQHVAQEIFRPNSRRYDLAEHAYPKELDMLGALLDGLNASGAEGAGAVGGRGDRKSTRLNSSH